MSINKGCEKASSIRMYHTKLNPDLVSWLEGAEPNSLGKHQNLETAVIGQSVSLHVNVCQ